MNKKRLTAKITEIVEKFITDQHSPLSDDELAETIKFYTHRISVSRCMPDDRKLLPGTVTLPHWDNQGIAILQEEIKKRLTAPGGHAKQRYTKWIKHYPDGTLGSVSFVIQKPGFEKLPLAIYEPGKDTKPEVGYLMCWKGVRESDIERAGVEKDICLWEVEVEVADVSVPYLAHPWQVKTGRITIQEFWANPKGFKEGVEPFNGHRTPTQTVFCTRVRLIKNLTFQASF